ncbi:MAG: hypothetical protein Q4F97_06505 [Bacteroidales bacterium]|nr:hypothetical protein [Bacteroidales bacterium]
MNANKKYDDNFDLEIKEILKEYPLEKCDSNFTFSLMNEIDKEYQKKQKRESIKFFIATLFSIIILIGSFITIVIIEKINIFSAFNFFTSSDSFLSRSIFIIISILIIADAIVRKRLYTKTLHDF